MKPKSIHVLLLRDFANAEKYRATWGDTNAPSMHQAETIELLVRGLAQRLFVEGERSDGDAWKWLNFEHPWSVRWYGQEWRCIDIPPYERKIAGEMLGKELAGRALGRLLL